jgi:RNA polymerase sigma-70 factor, ECF subfamily
MSATPHLRLVPPPGDAAPSDFEAIFRQHARYVAAIALRVLGRNDEVDDVVQDVFLAAMKDLAGLRSAGAVKGWLATVTVRHAARRLRRRRLRRLLHLDRDCGYEDVAAPGASPEQRALLGRVYALLDGLPVADRLAWTLRHLEGEQIDAVAALCGCSPATAKRRIAAAHEAIERMLADDEA